MKKRFFLLLTIFLGVMILASCGGREENGETGESAWRGIMPGIEDLSEITERTRYYDIMTESVEISCSDRTARNSKGEICVFCDTVLYGEEAVQIWEASRMDNTVDIWLYRADESWELLLSGISREYSSMRRRRTISTAVNPRRKSVRSLKNGCRYIWVRIGKGYLFSPAFNNPFGVIIPI